MAFAQPDAHHKHLNEKTMWSNTDVLKIPFPLDGVQHMTHTLSLFSSLLLLSPSSLLSVLQRTDSFCKLWKSTTGRDYECNCNLAFHFGHLVSNCQMQKDFSGMLK